jgi:hypothetical protein
MPGSCLYPTAMVNCTFSIFRRVSLPHSSDNTSCGSHHHPSAYITPSPSHPITQSCCFHQDILQTNP